MAIMSRDERAQQTVDSHRASIRDQIDKYQGFRLDNDQRTWIAQYVSNIQAQINMIRREFPTVPSSWEDTWRP